MTALASPLALPSPQVIGMRLVVTPALGQRGVVGINAVRDRHFTVVPIKRRVGMQDIGIDIAAHPGKSNDKIVFGIT